MKKEENDERINLKDINNVNNYLRVLEVDNKNNIKRLLFLLSETEKLKDEYNINLEKINLLKTKIELQSSFLMLFSNENELEIDIKNDVKNILNKMLNCEKLTEEESQEIDSISKKIDDYKTEKEKKEKK